MSVLCLGDLDDAFQVCRLDGDRLPRLQCDFVALLGYHVLAASAGQAVEFRTSDTLELGLRRVASYTYIARTGDTTGGVRMLGVVTPGTSVHIAPGWMVKEVTGHSKTEYYRDGRVASLRRRATGAPKGKVDPEGRGKGKKGGVSDRLS